MATYRGLKDGTPTISGRPMVRLDASDPPVTGVIGGAIVPGRGMMLLQARVRLGASPPGEVLA